MNKSQLFINAHKVAKATVKQVGNYMIAFSLALINEYKKMKESTVSPVDKLLDLGFKVWNEKRIYININDMPKVINGLNLEEPNHKGLPTRAAFIDVQGNEVECTAKVYSVAKSFYFDIQQNTFVGNDEDFVIMANAKIMNKKGVIPCIGCGKWFDMDNNRFISFQQYQELKASLGK